MEQRNNSVSIFPFWVRATATLPKPHSTAHVDVCLSVVQRALAEAQQSAQEDKEAITTFAH